MTLGRLHLIPCEPSGLTPSQNGTKHAVELDENTQRGNVKTNKIMKKTLLLIVVLCLLIPFFVTPSLGFSQENQTRWEVYFSPNGEATKAIVKQLNTAQNTIFVQAYYLSSEPIARALLNAHKRRVKVEVILDKSQRTQKYSSATFLYNAGIPIHIDAKHAIAHNKVMIIDAETLITGSFNFTQKAQEKNAENLLVLRDRKLALLYMKNWQEHAGHSELYIREKREGELLGTSQAARGRGAPWPPEF